MMRKYPVRFGGGPMEKCHIQLLTYNWVWKLASGLPDHDALVIDETNRQVGSCRLTHTVEGLTQLKDFLFSISGPERKEEMACIIETTHGLLIASLLEAGFPVYPVNPKTVDRRRNAAGAKTDKIDAYLLAKHGRAEWADLRRLEPDGAIVQELKALTRDQESLIQSQTRL